MKTRNVVLTGIVSLCALCAVAQTDDKSLLRPVELNASYNGIIGQQIPADTSLLHGQLNNGMEYYIYHNLRPDSRGKVSMCLVQKTGAAQETDDEQGMAHFLEHMLFNGTAHFPGNSIQEYANSIGLRFGHDLNATTTFDHVHYDLPDILLFDNDARLDSCLLILRDWACDAVISPDRMESERSIVLNEIALHEMQDTKAMGVILAGTPYAKRYPVGLRQKVEKISVEQMRSFYKKWYQPQNQALVIVGDIDRYKVLQHVERLFATIPRGTTVIPQNNLDLAPRVSPDVTLCTTKSKNAEVEISFSLPAITDPHQQNTVETIFENRMAEAIVKLVNNRINNIKANNPSVIDGGAYMGHIFSLHDVFAYNVSVQFDAHSWQEILAELIAETERLKNYGWLKNEIRTELGELAGDGILTDSCLFSASDVRLQCSGDADNVGIINVLIDQAMWGRPLTIASGLQCYMNRYVDAHMSQALIYSYYRQIVDNSRISIVLSMPEASGVKLPKQKDVANVCSKALKNNYKDTKYANATIPVEAILHDINLDIKPGHIVSREIVSEAVIDPYNIEYKDSLRAVRLSPDSDKSSIDVFMSMHPKETTKFLLDNGVTVIVREDMVRSATVCGFKYGGMSIYEDDEAKIAPLYKHALKNVLPNVNSEALSGGMTVGNNVCSMNFKYSGEIAMLKMPTHQEIDNLFKYIHVQLTNCEKDQRKFDSFMKTQDNSSKDLTLDDYEVIFSDLVYNWNEAGKPLTSQERKLWNADKVLDLYRRQVSNYNGAVFVIESVSAADELVPYIEKYFASLPSSEKPQEMVDRMRSHFKSQNGKASHLFTDDTPVAYTRALYVQEKGFDYNINTFLDQEAAVYVLQRLLLQRLRIDNNYVYYVSVWGHQDLRPYKNLTIAIQTASEPANRNSVADIIHQTLKDIAYSNVLTDELVNEFKTDKNNETVFDLAPSFANKEVDRLLYGDSKIDTKNPEEIEKVSVNSVKAFVKSLLENGNVFDFDMTTQE